MEKENCIQRPFPQSKGAIYLGLLPLAHHCRHLPCGVCHFYDRTLCLAYRESVFRYSDGKYPESL